MSRVILASTILFSLISSLMAREPRRPINLSTTTRYFSPNGSYMGYSRTYNSTDSYRSYYYNSKGSYAGQEVGRRPK